jgi:hypothetical protein
MHHSYTGTSRTPDVTTADLKYLMRQLFQSDFSFVPDDDGDVIMGLLATSFLITHTPRLLLLLSPLLLLPPLTLTLTLTLTLPLPLSG